MALSDVIRSGIATAKSILSSGKLLVPVTHSAFVGQNEYGEPSFGAPVTRYAVVSATNEIIRDPARGEIVARLAFLFLEDVAVSPRDKLTLSDGTTTPIVQVVTGVLDSSSDNFYVRVLVE